MKASFPKAKGFVTAVAVPLTAIAVSQSAVKLRLASGIFRFRLL
jgi:hypothetical protein